MPGVPCTLVCININPLRPCYRKFAGFYACHGKFMGKFPVNFPITWSLFIGGGGWRETQGLCPFYIGTIGTMVNFDGQGDGDADVQTGP